MHELMTTKVVSRQFILNELYRPLVQGADFLTFFCSLLGLLASFDVCSVRAIVFQSFPQVV